MTNGDFFDQFREDPEYQRELAAQRLLIEAGDRLNELVEMRGIQRQELAERLGVSASRVSQALRGEENLTLRTLGRLCHALDAYVSLQVVPNEWQFNICTWDKLSAWGSDLMGGASWVSLSQDLVDSVFSVKLSADYSGEAYLPVVATTEDADSGEQVTAFDVAA